MNDRAAGWLLLLIVLGTGALASAPAPDRLCIERHDGAILEYVVELAVTPAARVRGLMGRRALRVRHGMWFDFGEATRVQMWMRDTLLSLDIVFVDERGIIVHIASRTEPLSLARLAAPVPVRYVLEVNAGEMAADGVTVGDRVRLPPG